MKIEDRIKYTRQGYDYIEVTPLEILKWGGMCICNGCGKQKLYENFNLVWVLGDCYCKPCFTEWEARATRYEEDLEKQKEQSIDWYKYHLNV